MAALTKSDLKHVPEFYAGYVQLVENIPVVEALRKYGSSLLERRKDALMDTGDRTYAPGKWTVKDLLQHVTDSERVFSYRALRIARGDQTPLPGFEQDHYVQSAAATDRKLEPILREFNEVRSATISLFESFSNEELLRVGTASDVTITPLALGYITTGHVLHHLRIIEERYFPLAKTS